MRISARMKCLVAFVAGVSGSTGIASAQQSPLIVLSSPSEPALAERGIVTFTISNPTDEQMAVVSFETPFAITDDRLANPEFEVSDAAGHKLDYKGRQVRFGPPDPSNFLIIGPHQTISKNVDLAADYNIQKGGAYKVTYVKTLRLLRSSGAQRVKDIGPEDDVPLEPVRSNTLTIWINDALMTAASAARARRAAEDAVGICTESQSATLGSDVSAATSKALAALFYLQSGYTYDKDENGVFIHAHQTDPRYTYWFGTYDSSVFLNDPESVHSDNAQVDQIIAATAHRLANGPMSFACGCTDNYPPAARAWAETGSPYLVHICASYFNDPTTGSPAPSRVATMVHEASHFFDRYATGTGDPYLTSPEAHAAAVSARSTAVRAAVNYEFYIMNATHP